MIKANFNAYASYVTDTLYQWEIDRVLSVSGLNLSVAPEVHFSNANMDRAVVKQSVMNKGIVSVTIPNSLLQDPLTIHAHIGIYEGDTFKVLEKIEIPVLPRKRPVDYRIEDSDEEIYSFKELENHIANMVKQSDYNANNTALNARIDNIIVNASETGDNAELIDSRMGYDGKTYPSSGTAIRDQTGDIVKTLIRSGLYSETVLIGEVKEGVYVVKNSGLATETEQSTRGAITYDISEYAGKMIHIRTVANSTTMYAYVIADKDGKVLEIVNGNSVYNDIVSLPFEAHTLYVNYALSQVEQNNVVVKVIDTMMLPNNFERLVSGLENTNYKLDSLAKDGTLRLFLAWEMGGISTTGEIYSPDDIRIRTKDYYKSNFNAVRFVVPDGYRMLAVFYTYSEDTGEYVYSRHRGYATGSGEFSINEGEYIRFVLRGVEDITFTGDEHNLLNLYHCVEALATVEDVKNIIDKYGVPDYWIDDIRDHEQEIKNIIYEGASVDNDIVAFFTVADPHYPDNTNVSTALMRYLSEKCGIGLAVCLGDIIADSPISRDDGLLRIHDAMTYLKNMSDRMILTQGNHDTNVQINDSNGQISADRIVYDKEWILHTSNRLLTLNKIVFDKLGKAFYYDDDILKIRFISLDSFEGKTYEIVNGILTSLHLGRTTDRQIEWLTNVALQNIPDNYSVITFSHLSIFPAHVPNGNGVINLNVGQMGNYENVLDAIKQYVNNGGDYIGHFAGHLHHDFISFEESIVSVHSLNDGVHWREASYFGDNAEMVGDSPLKVKGTVNECAFDVVIVNKTYRHVDLIRVGAGENREFDY